MKVALTFDAEFPDQPHHASLYFQNLLQALTAHEVQATFFLQGKWARANPDLARSIAEQGHQIGSHGYSHAPYPFLTEEGIVSDLEQAQEAIVRATGVQPWPLFRFPYGQSSSEAYRVLEQKKYQAIGWNVDSQDYRPETTPEKLIANVLSGVQANGKADLGSVVLMHTWPSGTVLGLKYLIVQLKDIGAEFGTFGV